ncbi:MAG: MMPL family transporter [Spirochaetales bacterium]|nr:MMPL family transporter [Spirochaetales bacterium]
MDKARHSIFQFSSNHPKLIIIITLLLTVFFAFFALRININADYASLLPEDTLVNQQIKEFSGDKPESELFVLAIKGENLFTKTILSSLNDTINTLGDLPEVQSVISPFNFVIFERSPSGRLIIGKTFNKSDSLGTEEGVTAFTSRLFDSSFAENLVVSKDRKMLNAFFFLERSDEYGAFLSEVNKVSKNLSEIGVSVHTSGLVVLNERTRFYITRDVSILIILAIMIVIAFYFLTFRTGKAVFMPIFVVLFGTVWSIGFMSLMNYSLTLISIVAPPLILIFGNEYAIYVMSEYYRLVGHHNEHSAFMGTEVIPTTTKNVTKPIILAFITTVIGFLSLYVTDIKQTQEFALVASFGSLSCGVISLFFLPALLSLAPLGEKKDASLRGYNPVIKRLSALASNHPRAVLLVMPVFILAFAFSLQFLQFNTDSINYFPKKDPAIKDMYVLTEAIGGFDEINVTFLAPEGTKGYFNDPILLEKLLKLEKDLKAHPDVCYALSFPSYLEEIHRVMGSPPDTQFSRGLVLLLTRLLKAAAADESMGGALDILFNEDFTRLTLNMRIYNSTTGHFIDEYRFREFLSFLKDTLKEHGFQEDDAVIWGEIMRNLHLADSLRGYLLISMVISLGLILIITSVTFRSVLYGLYAVLPLALGLMLNFVLMALFKIPLDMTTIMVSNVTIGVGIDNAFYLVVQYRRSLQNNHKSFSVLIHETLEVILRPTVLSTLSIALGLMVFLLAAFKPIVYFGMLVIFSLTATAACTLIVLPAILYFDSIKRKVTPK